MEKKEFRRLLFDHNLTVAGLSRLLERKMIEYNEKKLFEFKTLDQKDAYKQMLVFPQKIRYWIKKHPATGKQTSPKDDKTLKALAEIFGFKEVVTIKGGIINYIK